MYGNVIVTSSSSLPFNMCVSCINSLSFIFILVYTRSTAHNQFYCGESYSNGRIYGGHDAQLGQFPWIVSLQYKQLNAVRRFYWLHSCGGSVIAPHWILTAAHCVEKVKMDGRALGGCIRRTRSSCQERFFEPKDFRKHERYNDETLLNDIALIQIESPFVFDKKTIGAICLMSPKSGFRYTGYASVAGWGLLSSVDSSTSPLILKTATLELLDMEKCKEAHGSGSYTKVLCAGHKGRDTCPGDSGGPMMVQFDHVWYLIGLVSWGDEDCRGFSPAIYTKVSDFHGWIQQKTKLRS